MSYQPQQPYPQQHHEQQQQQAQQQQQYGNFDWNAFDLPVSALPDVPHPDDFETELDLALGADSQLLDLDTDPLTMAFLRSESANAAAMLNRPIDHFGGPRSQSGFSVHSTGDENASAYTYLSDTTSYYTLASSMHNAPLQTNVLPPELHTGFRNFAIEEEPAHTDLLDPTSFGPLPPTTSYDPSAFLGTPSPVTPSSIAPSPVASSPPVAPSPQQLSVPSQQRVGHVRRPSGGNSVYSDTGSVNVEVDDPKKRHACPHCDKKFSRRFNLKQHIETHAGSDRVKAYHCPHPSCGRAFSRKHDLKRHLENPSLHLDSSLASANAAGASDGTSPARPSPS